MTSNDRVRSPAAFPGRPLPSESQHPSSSSPNIKYFISREDDTLVPMIPVDELPPTVRLQGIPLRLTVHQTIGMQHVDKIPSTGLRFKLENESQAKPAPSTSPKVQSTRPAGSITRRFSPPDAVARRGVVPGPVNASDSDRSLPPRQNVAHQSKAAERKEASSKRQNIIYAIVNSPTGAETAKRVGYSPKQDVAGPSGNTPDQDKKEYCTYWIRTGECDYMQQGCLYKHEMPDRGTLEKIGFRSVPRWWQERNQAVRLGGQTATVGPIVKASDWLKRRVVDESDEDEDEDTSNPEVSPIESEKEKPKVKIPEPVTRKTMPTEAKKPIVVSADKPLAHLARSVPTEERSGSAMSDLIDFAPLLSTRSTPSPVSPLMTPSRSTTESSVNGSPSFDEALLPSVLDPILLDEGKHSVTASKVFVPDGKSGDPHITQVVRRGYSPPLVPVDQSSSKAEAANVTKVAQTVQRPKSFGGLMASKHAPGRSEVLPPMVQPVRCNAGPKGRPRRAVAVATPSTPARQIEKK